MSLPKEVSFALPFPVHCTICHHTLACGTVFPALKHAVHVSTDGFITWNYAFPCPSTSCSSTLHLRTSLSAAKFVPHGPTTSTTALQPTTAPSHRRPRAPSSSSPPLPPVKAPTLAPSVVALKSRAQARAERDIAALRVRNSARNSALTADALQVRLVTRWDATPSRAPARAAMAAVEEARLSARKEVRKVRRAAKLGKGKSLGSKRGRMGYREFGTARKAVRALHRGGALGMVLRAVAKGG